MKKIRIGILVSGRGSNMEAIIDKCKEGYIPGEVVIVISDNPDAPAISKAREKGVKAIYLPPGEKKTVLIGEAEEEYIRVLKEHKVDLVLLAGFMRIIKDKFLEAFKERIMNIHPALLPSFKGLNAQRQAWEYGVKYSGCTVHFVTKEVDGGPIILQRVVEVLDDDTPETLSERILKEEHKAYPEAVKLFAEGKLKLEERRVRIKR